MAHDVSGSSVRYLSTLFDVGVNSGLTDSQLLERFATHRGEAAELAFAGLLERHGPMVLALAGASCATITKRWTPSRRPSWSSSASAGRCGYATHSDPGCIASLAEPRDGPRQTRLGGGVSRCESPRTFPQRPKTARDDLAAIVHDELNRLPDRFRTPILLCDMEGRTCAEAAQVIGCPVGTVASRLSRGRDRLRATLGRRGLAVGLGALGTALSTEAAGAVLPPALVNSTARMAVSTIAGGPVDGVIPSGVITLVQETLKAMLATKVKVTTAFVLSAGLITTGALVVARQVPGSRPGRGLEKQDGLVMPATGAGTPVVNKEAGDRPREKRAGPEPTVKGKIVIFGEGKIDGPETHVIRVLDPDGAVSTRTIAELTGHAWSGRISPDGRRIAFLLPPPTIQGSDGINLWVMDADGRNRRMVIGNAGGMIGMGVACWSPDGRKIAFHRQNQGSPRETFVVDLDKRTLGRLNLSGNELVTSWSPDGTEWLISTLGVPPIPTPPSSRSTG